MKNLKKNIFGIVLLIPFLSGFIYFYIVPLLISFYYSFNFSVSSFNFAGLTNYTNILTNDAFLQAAKNTSLFIAIGLPLLIILSLLFAVMLNSRLKCSTLYTTFFLFPLVLPIASVVMFFNIFLDNNGVLNNIIMSFGFDKVDYLNSPVTLYVLIFLYIWKNIGYNIVILSSGLNTIPNDYYEAARLDGAGSFKCFRYITLPLISPTLFFVTIISLVNLFKNFKEAFLLCGDLPYPDIYMLQHFMNNNFNNLNYQNLSVVAILIFIVMFIFIMGYLIVMKGLGKKNED